MRHRLDIRFGPHLAGSCLLMLALLLGTGCGTDQPPEPTANAAEPSRGGTVVLGSITDMDSWNEYTSRQSFATYVLRRIFPGLATGEGDGGNGPESFEPLLAESWERSEDGLTITFRLREATWSDGHAISAEDVRFTWLAQTSDEVPWANADVKSQITDVVVDDERTVTFHFDHEYAYALTDAVVGGILPQHVFGKVPFDEWATHDWSSYTIGSGPFLLERYTAGQEIVLARNPLYFDPEFPLVDRVVVRIVPDVLNLVTQLQSGEIDFMTGIPPREASRLTADSRAAVEIVPFRLPRYEYLGWNGKRPPFDDRMVRRALTLAIDRAALVEDLLYDFGEVSSRPVPSHWWGAAEDLDPWPYDPEQARSILAERGFSTVAADGTAVGRGPALEFDLVTNTGNRLREDALVKIQAQLARIGVTVHVRSIEQRTLIQNVTRGEFDGYLGGWNFIGKVPLGALFGSDYAPPRGFNVVGYHAVDVDATLAQLDLASDWREMKPLLDTIQRRIHDDQPYTFLFERDGIAAFGSRLHNVRIDHPDDPLAGLERVWVASSEDPSAG